MFSKFNVSKKGELCHRTTLHCGLLKSLEVVDTDTQSINQQVCPRERLLALIYVEFFHMRWRAMNIQPSGLISTPPNTARHRQIPPRAAAHLQYRPGAPIAGCAGRSCCELHQRHTPPDERLLMELEADTLSGVNAGSSCRHANDRAKRRAGIG